MDTQALMEARIWDWLDGQCSESEKTELQQLVNTLPEWKAKYHELLEVHNSLKQDLELMQPSMRFTKNVMEQIAALSINSTAKNYLNNKIIYAIGGLFVLMISAVIVYTFSILDWASSSNESAIPDLGMSSINWSAIFSGNFGIIGAMVIAILSMVLLDQYLRPKMLRKSKGH